MLAVRSLTLAAVLTACAGDTPPAAVESEPSPTPVAQEAPAEAEHASDAPSEEVLVPSPARVQAALAEAGIEANVEKLVKKGTIAVQAESKDEVAVRVGVLLANLVLTAKQAPKEDTLARLAMGKQGFAALGAGADIGRTIDDITARLQNDAINSDDLVAELDELARVLVPEVSYEAGERSIPLIQAGGWLAGTHFVSGAILQSGKIEAAGSLLKHPEVAGYFLEYVTHDGADKAPPIVISKVETSLRTLEEVAQKDTLTADDVKAVKATTRDVLSLL